MVDVPDGVHESSVDCLIWYGIARGVDPTHYLPESEVRRDQMASFVIRLLSRAGVALPVAVDHGFTDLVDNPHAEAVGQLASLGVVKGTTPSTYSPSESVTRAQMATFLVRAYERATGRALPDGEDAFDDDTGNVHEASIDKAAAAGMAMGTGPRRFEPAAPVSRAQMATFLVRMLEPLYDEGLVQLPSVAE